MRKLFILMLILLLVPAVQAQTEHIEDEVKKLNEKIISGSESDREKVEIIHDWITHNIKYNVQKYLDYDFTVVPLDKILKSKKAICYGYSSLFDALCTLNGIPSVTVNGYVKSPEVDPVDSFYLDQHCWNAVLLDDTWFLLDVTWDAGYTGLTVLL